MGSGSPQSRPNGRSHSEASVPIWRLRTTTDSPAPARGNWSAGAKLMVLQAITTKRPTQKKVGRLVVCSCL